MQIHNIPQHLDDGQANPDWLALRAGKFSGSEAAILLSKGETKRKLILEKATEHIIGKPCNKNKFLTDDMARGIMLEPIARQLYMETTFNDVVEVGFIERDEFSGCSPDGLVDNDGLIEIKSPKDTIFIEQSISKEIRPEYYSQIQYNLFITGRDWCDYVAYNENFPLLIRRYGRDEEFISKIEKSLNEAIIQTQEIINLFIKKGV